jgi:hypothetical protein
MSNRKPLFAMPCAAARVIASGYTLAFTFLFGAV